MASKTILLLALTFAIVLLISSSEVMAEIVQAQENSELDGRGGYGRGGYGKGGYGKGGKGGYGRGGYGKGGKGGYGKGKGGRKGRPGHGGHPEAEVEDISIDP
ncbi:glycine-rich cell wall structural protein-like [Mercurialis annua]|uniref:glycine-rich cell wall structural protein-like n=1 Tax=Mercurialis annua TaxID=3986 RepID=UPI0021602E2A|nr:glycine-rich cell wall structural protein-like [Mercurialis annua]